MAAKDYCRTNPAVAYVSRNAGLEIHGIEYGVNDYVYAVSGAWAGTAAYRFHRVRIDSHRQREGIFPHSGKPCIP
jgi:hypothetical protein